MTPNPFDHLDLSVDDAGHVSATHRPYTEAEIMAAAGVTGDNLPAPPALTYGNMSAGLPPAVGNVPPLEPMQSPNEKPGHQIWVDSAAQLIGRYTLALRYYARGGNDGGDEARKALEGMADG